RPLADDDKVESDDDTWLDDIALLTFISDRDRLPTVLLNRARQLPFDPQELPSCMVSRKVADERLIQYRHFLDTLESPVFDNVQA
ncbi:hypothetical protein GGG16DRAFT_33790, partial [Schizophyllum commune]